MVEAIDVRVWRRRRLLYYAGLVLFFGSIAFFFGPNYFLFKKLTWISPADFVPTATSKCAPVVRAIKEYHRDHGRYPSALLEELGPEYDRSGINTYHGVMWGTTYEYWTIYNHHIEYEFTEGAEGWSVRGVYTRGPLPMPLVTIAPSSQPTNRQAK